MFGNDSGDRTIAPTPRRLAEARRAGDVPNSREFTTAVAACVAMISLSGFGPHLWTSTLELLQASWSMPATRFDGHTTPAGVDALVVRIAWILAGILSLPLLAALLTTAIQAGFRPLLQRPQLRWSHVSPLSGGRRMWTGMNWFSAVQLAIKAAAACLVTAHAVHRTWPGWSPAGDGTAAAIAASIGRLFAQCGIELLAVLVLLSFVDWYYRRRQFARRVRLTPAEARAEVRDSKSPQRSRTRRSARVSDQLAGSIEPASAPVFAAQSARPEQVLREAIEA
jgi:flagellar biosynthetic protein FlhB